LEALFEQGPPVGGTGVPSSGSAGEEQALKQSTSNCCIRSSSYRSAT